MAQRTRQLTEALSYDELDQRIARTRADKTYLMVLEHPEVPLHNNPAELDARTRVRKRAVSYDLKLERERLPEIKRQVRVTR
jgi:hypothetical protein